MEQDLRFVRKQTDLLMKRIDKLESNRPSLESEESKDQKIDRLQEHIRILENALRCHDVAKKRDDLNLNSHESKLEPKETHSDMPCSVEFVASPTRFNCSDTYHHPRPGGTVDVV